jgi:hypothetical protein
VDSELHSIARYQHHVGILVVILGRIRGLGGDTTSSGRRSWVVIRPLLAGGRVLMSVFAGPVACGRCRLVFSLDTFGIGGLRVV